MKLFFLLVAVSCLVHSVAGYGSGISSTVFSLANYQAEDGGFTTQVMEEGASGLLDDTAHALFLTSLFGVKDKIDVESATNFITSLQNSDGGYSNTAGQNSDLESVWNALLAYRHLGSIHPDTSKLVKFVNSLYDSNAKLYRNTASSSPDYKATARALQIFQILELEDKDVAAKKAEIAEKLNDSVKDNDKGHSFFSSLTSDNYFAILVADLTGFELEEPEDWIGYFRDRQVPSGPKMGGFYSDDYATEVDVSDAEYSVHALFILNKKVKLSRTQLNLNTLNGYLNSLPPALATAAHAYAALARTASLQELFKIVPSYVVQNNKFKIQGSRVIEGSLFRPNLFFRTTYGQAHSGASASVVFKHADKTDSYTFSYNAQSKNYETQDYFDTTGLYGELVLTYTLTWTVPGFEDLSFNQVDRKSVGFDLVIAAKAVSSYDEFDPHETVDIPTSFTFDVQLGTVSVPRPELVKGDFDVVLTVLDSSNIALHTEVLDARTNTGAIAFKYDLDGANLPSGRLSFRVQIKSDKGIHTTEEVWYNVRVTMIATNIDFDEGQTFNFGQTVKLSMQPATYFGKAVETYEKVGPRRIYLDLHSPKQVLLASFQGNFQNDKYIFEFPITARFDFVGTHVLSFRFQDAAGNDFPLKNYNSEEESLYDEDLSFVVEAGLELEFIDEAPEAGSLSYGQEVAFSFIIKDTWTESPVQRGSGDSTAFLALRHKDSQGKTFTSTKVRANPERAATGATTFKVNWEVDPNALKGAGQLVLFATDADGNELPLQSEGAAWAIDVTVEGALKIDHKAYSRVYDDFDTAFFVSFDLTSQENKLAGAELSARVTYKSGVIAILPVAASFDGNYQVSWTLPTERATSGDYVVDIFRRVDLDRADNDYASASPFFTVTVGHEGRVASPLPFKTEFLVLLVLGVTLVSVSVQKTELEKIN